MGRAGPAIHARIVNVVIVQGHPDPAGGHFCHALAAAYAQGAAAAGHAVRRVEVARLDFPWLRTKVEFDTAPLPAALAEAQAAIAWAGHVVFVYPLWLGGMPAVLKAFLEQIARPGFAFAVSPGGSSRPALRGKSARVIVTMGMPAAAYRWYFRAHSLKSFARNVLNFVGIKPVRSTLIGSVEAVAEPRRAAWLRKVAELGRAAA
jgi:putative NADPH-quinone reductase